MCIRDSLNQIEAGKIGIHTFTNASEYTISWILIGEVKKVVGQKMQEVRIVYNFVGEIPEIAA